MKNLFILLTILSIISCKAQIYPLITSSDNVAYNGHVKDLDNEYNDYVGTWKATTDSKTITLKITKILDKPMSLFNKNYFQDVLIIQHKITAGLNNTIEDYITPDLNNYKIISTLYSKNQQLVRLSYEGVQCGVGGGLISIKLINPTHFEWSYNPDGSVLNNHNCPDYPAGGIEIHLPYDPKNIIFTKQ